MTDISIQVWKQANQIYTQLMDLTVSDALSELSQMEDISEELKGVVLSLISSGNLSSQFFNQQVGSNFQTSAINAVEYKPGDQIDDYQLLEQLGSGGMAKVYKARKVGADSQKPVAIKLFNRSGFSTVLQDRFTLEQEVLSGLSHPNIVNMHHGGTSKEGVPYIVMDLIEQAQDIDEYVRSHRAGVREIIYWVLSAAEAIAYAHNNLIVHRDIKPSNLLIDASGRLKVVDFGIAKLMTREDAPQKTTIMALTPTFAAPEQINSGHISVTTDVFSLAAVCLALIIKDLPLPADRMLKSCAGDEAHIWQVLRTKVKDKDLRNILNHAMQQNPLSRYRNMDLLVDDLSAWLADKPVLATPDSWLYRIKKFAIRRSALFAALSTLVVMALLAIVLLGWQVDKTQAEAAKANEVKDFMLGVFSVVNPDDALGEKILAKDLLSQAFAEIKDKQFKDPSIKVELLTAMGQAQLQLGLNQPATQSFNEALAIDKADISANLGVLRTVLARGDMSEANEKITQLESMMSSSATLNPNLWLMKSVVSHNKGDYDLAESQAKQAQQVFERQVDIKGYLEAGRQLSNIMYLRSESKAAAMYLEQQLEIGLEKLAPTSTVILAIENDLVELYNDTGEYDLAIKHAEQLIENIITVLGEKHPFLIQAYISRAGTNRSIGKIEEAKSDAKSAYDLSVELNGEAHESSARSLNLMAVLSYVNGEIELALTQMKRASELFDLVLGSDHPESWDVKTNLTALLNMAQRFDEAIEIIEPVFNKQSDILGASHKSTIYSQTVLARLYGDVGRLNEAQQLAEEMLNTAINELGFDHPLTVGGHFTLAKILQKQGNFSTAIALIQSVIKSDGWRDDNERVITAYNTLADLYMANDEVLAAAEFKEKSLQVSIDLLTKDSPRTLSQMVKNTEFYILINDQVKAQSYIDRMVELLESEADGNNALKLKLAEFQQAILTKSP